MRENQNNFIEVWSMLLHWKVPRVKRVGAGGDERNPHNNTFLVTCESSGVRQLVRARMQNDRRA